MKIKNLGERSVGLPKVVKRGGTRPKNDKIQYQKKSHYNYNVAYLIA